MGYVVMRHNKIKQGGTYSCIAEHNRTADDAGKYLGKIDPTKTADNVYLVDKCTNIGETIKKELHEHGIDKKPRKDAVLLIDMVFTGTPETLNAMDRETQLQYFRDCVDFANRYYGKVVNAVVHYDETTPHLHVDTIPLMYDRKKDKWKLSAKEIVGNVAKMTQMQTLIAEEVGIMYGLERGIQESRKHGREHQDSADHNYNEKQKAIKIADEQLAIKKAQQHSTDELLRDTTKKIIKKMDAMDEAEEKFQNLYRNIKAQSKYLADHAFEMAETEIRKKEQHILNMKKEMETMDLSDCFER